MWLNVCCCSGKELEWGILEIWRCYLIMACPNIDNCNGEALNRACSGSFRKRIILEDESVEFVMSITSMSSLVKLTLVDYDILPQDRTVTQLEVFGEQTSRLISTTHSQSRHGGCIFRWICSSTYSCLPAERWWFSYVSFQVGVKRRGYPNISSWDHHNNIVFFFVNKFVEYLARIVYTLHPMVTIPLLWIRDDSTCS